MSSTVALKTLTVWKAGFAACVVGLLAGCASTEVTSNQEYEGLLAKPGTVLVDNFAAQTQGIVPHRRLDFAAMKFSSANPTACNPNHEL